MIDLNAQAFLAREYPLLKLFEYGDDILLYDAKPNFAFILTKEELAILVDFLRKTPATEILRTHGRPGDAEAVRQLLAKLAGLKQTGVFIAGPAAQVAPVDDAAIREQLQYFDESIVLRKFCLQVTENCNFRCTYCKRTLSAAPASTDLSETQAFQAIDYYFAKYTAIFNKLSPDKKALLLEILPPTLSFYGGEPFLNFALIQQSTAYFQSRPWAEHAIPAAALRLTANTNLSLIDDAIIAFLVAHQVTLFASLDGPAEEHDRCRVLADGRGTFGLAYANLEKIRAAAPAYFREKVSIFGVFTPAHNYQECVGFTQRLGAFNSRHFPADYAGVFVPNPAAERRFYQQALASGLADYKAIVAADEGRDIDKFHNIFPFAKLNYDRPHGANALAALLTCPMGFDNLMVAANGDFLICHKVAGTMPIGHCATGLDFDKLADLFRRYNTAVNNPECRSCWAVKFCGVCAASRMDGTDFSNPSPEECDLLRLKTAYNFSCFIHLARERPALLQRIFAYRQDPHSYIGVIDIHDF